MTQPPLIPGYPDPDPPPDPYDRLGHDARRTLRQRRLIEAGVHPATHQPLARPGDPGDGHRCGDCAHLLVKQWRPGRRWFKCELQLHDGMGVDIRKRWPACRAWQPQPEEEEP